MTLGHWGYCSLKSRYEQPEDLKEVSHDLLYINVISSLKSFHALRIILNSLLGYFYWEIRLFLFGNFLDYIKIQNIIRIM